MSLRVITGRANTGKTGEVNACILASLERGESPVLLLPSVADVRRASSEYATRAPVGLTVSTFGRWADGLWRLHGDGRRIIGNAARDSFVQRAISEVSPPTLATVSATRGFSATVSRTVRAMTGTPDARWLTTDVARGVADICARYQELIGEGGLVEAAHAWRELAGAPPVVGGAVALNRFGFLEAPARALLLGLSQVNEVVVTLTWDEGFAPTMVLEATVRELESAADTTSRVGGPAPTTELTYLLDHLYSGSADLQSEGAVLAGLASGAEAEAALVAGVVSSAVERGTPPDRIAIAFPRLDTVSHGLETALTSAGLRFEVDVARNVRATPLGRSLDGLLQLALGIGDRATAIGLLLGPHSDVAGEKVTELDRTWRRFRVGDPSRLLSDISKIEGSLLGKAAAGIRSLARLQLDAETGKKWQNPVDCLVSAGIARAGEVESGLPVITGPSLQADAVAARAIVGAIGEMASVEGTPFSAGDLRSALRTIVAGGTGGESPGHVQVTEISRLRSRRFDVLVLGGLTAEEMPASKDDSLADELDALFTPDVAVDTGERARFEFYLALSRARERLVLVRRDADERGGAVRPSVLWEEVIDAYRTAGEGAKHWPRGGPPRIRVSAADAATSAPAFTVGRAELRGDVAASAMAIASPVRGQLHDPDVLARLASAVVLSATEIESYLQCPYRWFYERVVRPEEIDVELDARAIGMLAHSLLSAFYGAMPSELGATRVTPENVEEGLRLLERLIAGKAPEVAAEGLAEELDIARAARWVSAAIRDDAFLLPAFEPVGHELSFGGPGESVVTLGGVDFRGRIDRVDRSAVSLFVTDYKSSRAVTGQAKFASEGKIQAVVYAIAAAELFELPVAGSVYRSLRSPQLRGFWRPNLLGGGLALGRDDDAIDDTRFAELIAETTERIERAVAGIRAGQIPRIPANKTACAFCALKAQCEGAAR